MNKVENRKGKKRPFGETQSAKLGQKQENVSGFKKNFKKPKLAISTQNGDFKAENKAKSFKIADKQKQHKNVKQSYNTPSHLKEKVTAQSKEKSFKTKEKKIVGSMKTKLPKEKQQQQQQSPSQIKSPKKEYTVEHLEQRIKEIEGRENLSKTAKKKLSFYKKLLVKKTEGKESEKSVTEKKNIQTNKQTSKNVQLNKQKVNDKSKAKPKSLIETKHKAEEKQEDEDDDDDDFDDEDEEDTDDDLDDDLDNDLDNDAGLSDLGEEEEDEAEEEEEDVDVDSEDVDSEDSEEDKEFEEVDEEEEDGEFEDEGTTNLLNDGEDESDDDEISDEENDEEDDEIDTDDESDEITKVVTQSPKKKEDSPKKNQYSLFVKNLPNDAMENDIKQHFLKTVSKVISVTKNKNFAIVELANKTEYEKGLSLNQTKFKGKMISVQQYIPKKPIPMKRTDDPKSGKHPKDKTIPWVELKQNKKLQQKKGKNNN